MRLVLQNGIPHMVENIFIGNKTEVISMSFHLHACIYVDVLPCKQQASFTLQNAKLRNIFTNTKCCQNAVFVCKGRYFLGKSADIILYWCFFDLGNVCPVASCEDSTSRIHLFRIFSRWKGLAKIKLKHMLAAFLCFNALIGVIPCE